MTRKENPMTTKAEALRRLRQEAMAAKLRAAGWTVTPPPECATCGGRLDWVDGQYHCPDCGDEWDYQTIHDEPMPE